MKNRIKITLTFMLCFFAVNAFAQNENDEDRILDVVQRMPEYPDGDSARYIFLKENLTYPDSALNNDIQGKVYVTFVVEKDGSITEVKTVSKPKGFGLEEEAIRVVKMMPKWNPGMQNEKLVRVRFNLPISFKISH